MGFLRRFCGFSGVSGFWTRPPPVMMIVYWYSFSNHYTRECIHTCESHSV